MKMYLYPVWLRLWHWTNALFFIILIVSGISLHYSSTHSLLVPFKTAIAAHNAAGIALALTYLGFIAFNFATGNWRQYVPRLRGMVFRIIIQTRFYLSGIFNGDRHPFETTMKRKFNPLQQITYLGIMYVLMPVILASGLFMMFPQYAPVEVLGLGGIWPMATVHAAAGFFLSLFMFGHIYLATTGEKVSANFTAMFTGWHEHHTHEQNVPTS
jgi:thiosulfate reductase cytochrome b subunit